MSQYGKADYWEDRYTKYLYIHAETQNRLIGINASADSKMSSRPTSIKLEGFSMQVLAILD